MRHHAILGALSSLLYSACRFRNACRLERFISSFRKIVQFDGVAAAAWLAARQWQRRRPPKSASALGRPPVIEQRREEEESARPSQLQRAGVSDYREAGPFANSLPVKLNVNSRDGQRRTKVARVCSGT